MATATSASRSATDSATCRRGTVCCRITIANADANADVVVGGVGCADDTALDETNALCGEMPVAA